MLKDEIARQTATIEQQTQALRARKCLIDEAPHRAQLPSVGGMFLLLCMVLLSGCTFERSSERATRAQASADLDAGLVSAIKAAADTGASDAVAILTGARKYVAPAAGIPHAEWPVPTLPPDEIRKRPAAYGDSAPPEPAPNPWGFGLLAGLTTAGAAALWIGKNMLPLVPGIGGPAKGLIELVANTAWTITAHADQKKADAAKESVATAAAVAGDVIAGIRQVDPALLPPAVAAAIQRPDVAQALAVLAQHPQKTNG